ncbi:hypothetical protein SEUCBS139899_002992 [Sporothrix eucalyptigena]
MDSDIQVVFSQKPAQTVLGRASPLAPTQLEEFRGIPYGTVPGRWRHSVVRDVLPTDRFDATKNGPQCPQPDLFANSDTYQSYLPWPIDVGESEFDCLNLFIVRPRPQALKQAGSSYEKGPLPVYVVIHGGGFGFGAATDPMWDPSRLLLEGLAENKPFIAVGINYRLSVFGFGYSSVIAALQTDAAERRGGNFGLGDQRTAMRWISRHIAAFGGDPFRVTIAGQSAGGVSVHAHILEAKFGRHPPLFRRAIQQSGALGVMRPVSVAEVEETRWQAMYKALNLTAASAASKLDALLALSAADLLAAAGGIGWIVFAPVRDELSIGSDPDGLWVDLGRLDSAEEVPKQPEAKPLAVLLGECAEEGLMMNPKFKTLHSFEDLTQLVSTECPELAPAALDELWTAYNLSGPGPQDGFAKGFRTFVTDAQFASPVDCARAAFSVGADQKRQRLDGQPARSTETRSFLFKTGNPFPGPNHGVAHHCVDLIYIYDCFHDALTDVDHASAASTAPAGPLASNGLLVQHVQTQWVSFIVDDTVRGSEQVCTTFETDRTASERMMSEDPEWTLRRKRFAVLGKHAGVVKKLLGY